MAMSERRRLAMIEEVIDTLERHVLGKYAKHSISWCCDKIAWLNRFHYINGLETEKLTSMAREALHCSSDM